MFCLSKKQAQELIKHAKDESPNEACGILAGEHGKLRAIYRMANTDKSASSFFMDPGEQLKVMKEIRNRGWDMIGIYHSHPQTQSYPSVHDVELAYYPEASYIIVSLRDKNAPDIRSFRIVEGKIQEEEVRIK